ncbi:MAG: polysaccharide deacetylase family protein [Alphaproteobacteria bacterium]|nr:MAG: polysaccharide deacetylase family protein [Alphaproteobacteria bacterium]
MTNDGSLDGSFGCRARRSSALCLGLPLWLGLPLCLGLLLGLAAQSASAADCPGHPDAIGTSRTLVVDPREHPRIGTMQYPETLPLRDHEVVLTFDDGPLPRNSNQVLQVLADNCVKATFFTIGQQALANPEGVRKLAAAGHTIGTHTQDHPLTMDRMPIEKARQEIDGGIASVSAALSDPTMLAPFFRIPGLLRAEGVEEYLASRGIQVWSADFLADDWHHISSSRVFDLAIKRLEETGKGILLLHDIQARTAAALPRILHEMKVRGYHIVHVVPATPERPATPTDPVQWQLHPPSENVPIAHWPKIPSFAFAEAQAFAAPVLPNFDAPDGELFLSAQRFDRARRVVQNVPLPREPPWPRLTELSVQNTEPQAEGQSKQASTESGHSERAVAAAAAKHGRGARTRLTRGARHAIRVAHASHGAPKHQAHAGKPPRRPVHVASLKKR